MIWNKSMFSGKGLRQQLAAVFGLLLLPACGQSTSLDLKEKLTIAMIGVFETPQDADGNAEPRSMEFTFQGLKLNGATDVELYEGEPIAFSIVNRSQIIAEAELGDYVGELFNGITVTFTPTVTVVGKIEDELTTTLVNAALEYQEAITIEKAKSFRLNIKVQWKNIITRDEEAGTETLTPPSFSLEIKND